MAGLFESLFQGGVGAAGLMDQINRTEDLGSFAQQESGQIGQDAIDGTTFQPFTVASSTGNTAVDAQGNINAQLSEQGQQFQDSAMGAATGLFSQAAQDPAARQQELFQQMQAAFAPEQQRIDNALQSQLFAQGRGGITSAGFGGSSEQFANAKAREEMMLQNWMQSQGLAFNEQGQQASLAGQFSGLGNQQTSNLFNQLNSGIQASDLQQNGQIAGQNLSSQARTTGLEAQVNAQKTANDLYGGLFQTAGNVAGQVGGMVDNTGLGTKVNDWLNKYL